MEVKAQRRIQNPAYLAHFFRGEEAHTSFGPIGYIGPASSKRLKGFLPFKVDSNSKVNLVDSLVGYAINAMRDPSTAYDNQDLFYDRTRLSVRLITRNRNMADLTQRLRHLQADVEATIPLNASESVIYVGHNFDERNSACSSNAKYIEQQELVLAIHKGTLFAEKPTYSKGDLHNMGYHYCQPMAFGGSQAEFQLHGQNGIMELAQLMKTTYNYDLDSAKRVITDPNNIISIIRYANDSKIQGIAAMGIIECTMVNVGNKTFGFAEITDTVVRTDDRKKGMGYPLHLTVTTEAIAHVASLPNRPDIVFSESTMDHPTVMISSKRQGRTPVGFLPQHADIENTPTNLVVMHVSDDALKSLNRPAF